MWWKIINKMSGKPGTTKPFTLERDGEILNNSRLAFCTRKRSFACTQSQRLFHKKYPITVAYTKYSYSFIENGEQVMFTRINFR